MFATAGSRTTAMAGEALPGMGMAANLMGAMKLLGHWRQDFATVAGTFAALGTLGNVLATSPLGLLASSLGWRRALLAVGVTTVALALAFLASCGSTRRAPGGTTARTALPRSRSVMLRRLVTSRDYRLISFGAFLPGTRSLSGRRVAGAARRAR